MVNLLWTSGVKINKNLQIKLTTQSQTKNIQTNYSEEVKNDKTEENIVEEKQEDFIDEIEIKEIGTIEIPAISLIAPIAEDTTEVIMNQYVGHFKDTSLWNGNIGLAAHNRRISSKLFSRYQESSNR